MHNAKNRASWELISPNEYYKCMVRYKTYLIGDIEAFAIPLTDCRMYVISAGNSMFSLSKIS
jgi:hypothetical protein